MMKDIKFDGKHVDVYSSLNKVTRFTISNIYCWIFTGAASKYPTNIQQMLMPTDDETSIYSKPNLL